MSGFEDKPVLNAKYRNRNEIIASILEAAKEVGISKTRIMFTAYLSYEQLNEYLNGLLEKELLTCDSHTRTYNITPKGSRFLELYSELEKVE
ncbi:MAG: winged helix-turn-helix domain-containing protein [Nitrososphaeraceae archaeon]